ncbi:MAG: sigma-70 family RNA polymerase sigma factor [Myxococcota bacterium]
MTSHALEAEPVIDAGALFRRHAGFVANFLSRLGVERCDLDDVVQEVFMVAHRRGGFAPGPARPTTWLADIALKVNANRMRRRRRARVQAQGEVVERAEDPAASPAEVIDHQRSIDRVQQALDTLDEDRRAVFVLFELEGESCDAIAAGLGIPVGTVYSRLHAARRKFRKAHARLLARERPRRVAGLAALLMLGLGAHGGLA